MLIRIGLFAFLGASVMLLTSAFAAPPGPTTWTVEIRNHAVLVNGKEQPLRISGGDSVVWVNKDRQRHTATSNAGESFRFDTGLVGPGVKSKAKTFPAGDQTVNYHCEFHPDMTGSVIVGKGSPKKKVPEKSSRPHAH